MKTLLEIERQITDLYEKFYDEVGVDRESGILRDTNQKFPGAPFIGTLYPNVNKKILFVGLDIGSDEGMHTFQSRREIISHSANGKTEIPYEEPFNAHISGTYALAFALLYDTIGQKDSWQKFSSDENETAYTAIKTHHSEIPVELLDYICLTNAHKFVTIDRKNKGGDQDRQWDKVVTREKELELLKGEINIIKPEIIIFQGKDFSSIVPMLQLDNNIKTLVTYHPSYRDRYHKTIGYLKMMAEKINDTQSWKQ